MPRRYRTSPEGEDVKLPCGKKERKLKRLVAKIKRTKRALRVAGCTRDWRMRRLIMTLGHRKRVLARKTSDARSVRIFDV